MELFRYIGFSEHPFEGKSAEKEIKYLNKIFIKPRYYDTLKNGLVSGNTRFIIGDRGHGKTAILLELQKDLDCENIFTIRLEEFDGIPESNNDIEFVKLIIEQIAIKLAVKMFTDVKSFRRLSKVEKEFLDIIYTFYFKVLTRKEFEEVKNKVAPFKKKNNLKRFGNLFVKFFNLSGATATYLTAGMIREALGQNIFDEQTILNKKKYINEFEKNLPYQKDIKKTEYWNYKRQKEFLSSISKIIKKIGYSQVVIFVDKLDEFPPVTSNVGKIKDFIKPLLNDTSIFLSNDYVFSFTIWSKVQHLLESDGIRFDKVDVDSIKWNITKMEEILSKRLEYFSLFESVTFESLCPNEISRKKIIELSNGSPRDMILLLKRIYDEQNEDNVLKCNFDEEYVQKGIESFIEKYNFSAHSMSENSKFKKEVSKDINLVLKIKYLRFDFDLIIKNTGIKNANQSKMLCDRLVDLQIVKELDDYKVGGHKQYEIIDPKIEYLIKIGRTRLN